MQLKTVQYFRAALLFSCLPAWPFILVAQQGLAPSVQADLLRDKIYAQAKANDSDGVLNSLDNYHKLVSDYNLTFPPPLYWIEAKAAHEAGDPKRALSTLSYFLNAADHDSNNYKEALTLFPRYQQEVSQLTNLETDGRRQALRSRIPEVISQMNQVLVTEPMGHVFRSLAKGEAAKSIYLNGDIPEIDVSSFSVQTTCVTELEWDVFLADTGRRSWDQSNGDAQSCLDIDRKPPESSSHDVPPRIASVQGVSAQDILDFVRWMSQRSGKHWRLPTEAEMDLVALRQLPINWPGKLTAQEVQSWNSHTVIQFRSKYPDDRAAMLVVGECRRETQSSASNKSRNAAMPTEKCDANAPTCLRWYQNSGGFPFRINVSTSAWEQSKGCGTFFGLPSQLQLARVE